MRQSGFTLIELMVVLAIAAIIGFVAVPSYVSMVTNGRSFEQAQTIHSALTFARGQAVTLNRNVSACPFQGDRCMGDNWAQGFAVFVDVNGDGVLDTGNADVNLNDTMLRQVASIDANDTLNQNVGARIMFSPTGRPNGANGTFTFCPKGEETNARVVIIAGSGRVTTARRENGQLACL